MEIISDGSAISSPPDETTTLLTDSIQVDFPYGCLDGVFCLSADSRGNIVLRSAWPVAAVIVPIVVWIFAAAGVVSTAVVGVLFSDTVTNLWYIFAGTGVFGAVCVVLPVVMVLYSLCRRSETWVFRLRDSNGLPMSPAIERSSFTPLRCCFRSKPARYYERAPFSLIRCCSCSRKKPVIVERFGYNLVNEARRQREEFVLVWLRKNMNASSNGVESDSDKKEKSAEEATTLLRKRCKKNGGILKLNGLKEVATGLETLLSVFEGQKELFAQTGRVQKIVIRKTGKWRWYFFGFH